MGTKNEKAKGGNEKQTKNKQKTKHGNKEEGKRVRKKKNK